MPEDPKRVFKIITERTRKVREALKLVSSGKSPCFYYPACGDDFAYPLQHFSDRCDTFVFCDWNEHEPTSFVAAIKKINSISARGLLEFAIDAVDVEGLANMQQLMAKFFPKLPANLAAYLSDPPRSKGHYAELSVKQKRRKPKLVQALWFAMEGVNLYSKLFASQGTAPRILCIKNWGHNRDAWTPFGNSWAHLAKLVQDGRSGPEFLIARENDHDWPWTRFVDGFDDWDDQPVFMWARQQPTPRNKEGRKRRGR